MASGVKKDLHGILLLISVLSNRNKEEINISNRKLIYEKEI